MTAERLAELPTPWGIQRVSPRCTVMSAGGTCNTSAQTWASVVGSPCPTEVAPADITIVPSEVNVTRAHSNGPTPDVSTTAASPTPNLTSPPAAFRSRHSASRASYWPAFIASSNIAPKSSPAKSASRPMAAVATVFTEYGPSSGDARLRRRTSAGSIPRRAATTSSMRSRTKLPSKNPGPRTVPVGVLFVITHETWQR